MIQTLHCRLFGLKVGNGPAGDRGSEDSMGSQKGFS